MQRSSNATQKGASGWGKGAVKDTRRHAKNGWINKRKIAARSEISHTRRPETDCDKYGNYIGEKKTHCWRTMAMQMWKHNNKETQ